MDMTSQFWNYLELSTPVILSSPLNCKNPYGSVLHLKSIMNEIKTTLNDLKQLNLEAAALSRLIYRTKYKLRQEKSYKFLQMINRCLTNYLSMHLPFTLSCIQDTLSDVSGPSRQMMEWALVRVLGVAHLFHRVYSLCTEAAGHLFVRVKLMHMYEITFFSVAVVARIWTYAQFIVRKACEWYSSLHQFLDKLQPSTVPWLPKGCVLPEDLAQTLENPEYLKLNSVSKPDELLSELNVSIPESDKVRLNINLPGIIDLDDIGETVSRDSAAENCLLHSKIIKASVPAHKSDDRIENHKRLQKSTSAIVKNQSFTSKETSVPKTKNHKATKTKVKSRESLNGNLSSVYKHSINSINSSEDLITFLDIEIRLRNPSRNGKMDYQPLMKHFDKLQWSMMEKFMRKQIKLLIESEETGNSGLHGKLLKRVRKNIKTWVSS